MFFVTEYSAREALQEAVGDFFYLRPLAYEKKVTTHQQVAVRTAVRQQMTIDIARLVNLVRYEDYGDILENVPGIYGGDVSLAYRRLEESGALTDHRSPSLVESFIEGLVISQQAEDAASEIRRRKYLSGELELGELTDADREWFRRSAEDNRSQAEAFAQAAEAARVAAERAQAAAESRVQTGDEELLDGPDCWGKDS
jgi:hypothetical protein